jgi:chorismate mutase
VSAMQHKILVAGPRNIGSEDRILRIATDLSKSGITTLYGGMLDCHGRRERFGTGTVRALRSLKNAGKAAGVPVATEAANARQADQCLLAGVDALWIAPETTADTACIRDIASALANTGVGLMITNPPHPDLELWIHAIERFRGVRIPQVIAVHRGFAEYGPGGYRTRPIWRVPIELRRRLPELPLICEPNPICWPGQSIRHIAQQAMELLFDGLMVEVQCDRKAGPPRAGQITPAQYDRLVKGLRMCVPAEFQGELPKRIQLLRREIDAIDSGIITLLAKRMRFVRDIGRWKLDNNVSLFQPDRWQQMIDCRVEASVRQRISGTLVREIFERIHEEALNIQIRLCDGSRGGD